MSLSTDVAGADELAAAMHRIANELSSGPGFYAWGRDVGALLLRNARLKAPADTGEMRARFTMETTQTAMGGRLRPHCRPFCRRTDHAATSPGRRGLVLTHIF